MSGTSSTLGRTQSSDQKRGQFVATVAANVPLCREHFRLVLRLASFPQTAPGQFIQIACRDVEFDFSQEIELEWQPGEALAEVGVELGGRLALLRRPFSLAGRRDARNGVELDIIHRVVGVGTDWMASLKVGDEVLCCTQDYPRMRNTFKQRARRDGIVIKEVRIPIPA